MAIYCPQSKIFPKRCRKEIRNTARGGKSTNPIRSELKGLHADPQGKGREQTCKACISKMTKLVGPPLEIGIFDKILARVNAVATSPSSSIRSDVPVGKKGRTSVKEATKSFGRAYITESCSNITPGELKDDRKATCCPRIP